MNNTWKQTGGRLELTVCEAGTGAIVSSARMDSALALGQNKLEAQLEVRHPHLWQLNDPQLYRVTARVSTVPDP